MPECAGRCSDGQGSQSAIELDLRRVGWLDVRRVLQEVEHVVMNEAKILYQLWCYYETADGWKMEGFFHTKQEAEQHRQNLWDSVDTPCMPDWAVVETKVWW